MPKNTGYADYLALAATHNLELLHNAEELPDDINDPVLWRDLLTGTIFSATYHYVMSHDNDKGQYIGDRNFFTKYHDRYYALAELLGITYVYEPSLLPAPTSTKDKVKWRTATGKTVVASYHDLAYGNMTLKNAQRLGLDDEARLINYNEQIVSAEIKQT